MKLLMVKVYRQTDKPKTSNANCASQKLKTSFVSKLKIQEHSETSTFITSVINPENNTTANQRLNF